jgi:cyclopentanol dehydrogenase
MRFEGKTVMVTGAAQGIGAAIAQGFASEGATVYICDVKEEQGRAMAASMKAAGEGRFLLLDVTKEQAWKDAMEKVEAERGRLDVLINNAGISIRASFEEYPVDSFDQMMAVNVRGVFLGMKHAVPLMRRAGGGCIVNVSSVAGLIGHRYSPIAYIATKGAVTMMTKGVAVQYAQHNIRVNSVHPSTVETLLVAEMFKDPEKKSQRLSEIPMGRLATIDDVARAALFLASSDAGFITGACLPVDGGLTAS